MSHHFDTKLAKTDPRLNVADMYAFEGSSNTTVFVLTTNADVGLSAPDTFHPEGIYSFRVHTSLGPEDPISFKFRFAEPSHKDGQEHVHVQAYDLICASESEFADLKGDVVLSGETGTVTRQAGFSSFVGIVPDLWAANAAAFGKFMEALWVDGRFDPTVWMDPENFFERRNIMAIVLEVPNSMLGEECIHIWSNITLFGHAAEVQVARWGIPLFSHLFLSEPGTSNIELYHKRLPSEDLELFGPTVENFVEKLSTLARSTSDPKQYAATVTRRLCPTMLPYRVGSKASFTVDSFNGRALGDDALDIMFTLAANTPISDGVAPDLTKKISTFPFYGPAFTKKEQTGLLGIPQHQRSQYRGTTGDDS